MHDTILKKNKVFQGSATHLIFWLRAENSCKFQMLINGYLGLLNKYDSNKANFHQFGWGVTLPNFLETLIYKIVLKKWSVFTSSYTW